MPQGEPISHTEMLRWMRAHCKWVEPHDTEMAEAVLLHLERTQWRPIEDAPEGQLLAYSRGGIYRVGERFDPAMPGKWEAVIDRRTGRFATATHWMPLPPSPETSR